MGLFQAAYRTYETLDKQYGAGRPREGGVSLVPISHIYQNASIEIMINAEGGFVSAQKLEKENQSTIIPVTEKSAGRTSGSLPHPLAEQLKYIAAADGEKFTAYVEQLRSWAESQYTHPKVRAVLAYIEGETVLNDIKAAGIKSSDSDLVRFCVIPSDTPACHKDTELMQCFINYYRSLHQGDESDLCMITGDIAVKAYNYPKGALRSDFGAKLVSANDTSGYSFRGRFAEDREALSLGYEGLQKAHSALSFLIADQGVRVGDSKRVYLCWNPDGRKVPMPKYDDMCPSFLQELEEETTFDSYRSRLKATLWGKGNELALKAEDAVVIASFEAATTGRLSVTYYNELCGADFLQRVEKWYESLCVINYGKVQAPSLARIVRCAFGNERGSFIDVDSRILTENVGRLFHCMVDSAPIPADIVMAMANKCERLCIYKQGNANMLLTAACAVIRKYHNDKLNREEWKLALDESNRNRSYLFGRLLAIAEKVERDTYDTEGREPNAMRMQSVFANRPMYAWRIIEEQLKPYYAKLSPSMRQYYRKLTQNIVDGFDCDDDELGRKLSDVYLLGYYHQRSAFYAKKETKQEETNEQE